ncbi:MAG: hypothetical protein H7A00_00390 [Hahellaceae bacterium]|nr:hypothetical protein [Hahellaceae bacterium]
MGLEEDQEQFLIKRVDRAVVDAMRVIDASEHTRESFDKVLKLLHKLVDDQRLIVDDIVLQEKEKREAEDKGDASAMDVELF